jgi:hypothetical protein
MAKRKAAKRERIDTGKDKRSCAEERAVGSTFHALRVERLQPRFRQRPRRFDVSDDFGMEGRIRSITAANLQCGRGDGENRTGQDASGCPSMTRQHSSGRCGISLVFMHRLFP